MKTYHFLNLTVLGYLNIECTDADVLEWITTEIKNLIPSSKSTSYQFNGEVFRINLEKLGGKDYEVSWWLIKQLCNQGWEPLTPILRTISPSTMLYPFRKEIT